MPHSSESSSGRRGQSERESWEGERVRELGGGVESTERLGRKEGWGKKLKGKSVKPTREDIRGKSSEREKEKEK